MHEEKHQSTKIVGGPMAPNPRTPVEVVDIQFRTGAKVYFFDPNGIQVSTGDHVIIETTRGPEYGICTAGNHTVPFKDIVPPLRRVLRIANEADERTLSANRAKEKKAFDVCQQKIQEHKLDMQLVSAEYAFDGSKILFFFTSDDRVDFRELVKHLAGIFRTRIELRQIGVRDKAKMVGGLGICGRPFCCTEFLDDFQPVSIKMAKTQNLSLNPTKISGTCGRLMCCLKYEQDAYEDLIRNSPKPDSFVDTPDGRGTVVEVNLLRQRVKVRMEEQPEIERVYLNSEIAVLRNGKAKKNDPPIPADLAPISGNGKRPRLTEDVVEEAPRLDPIRFRYRPDDIVEEEPPAQENAPKTEERRRKKRPGDQSGKDRTKEHSQKERHSKDQPDSPKPAKPHKTKKIHPEAEQKPEQKPAKKAPKQPKPDTARADAPKPDVHKKIAPKAEVHPRPKTPRPKSDLPVKAEGQETRHESLSGQHRRKKPTHRPRKPHDGGAPKQGE